MRTALLILLAVAAPALASQTVWKWVDERGITHYSDRPVPGATRVELAGGNRSDPSAAPVPAPATPAAQPQNTFSYRNFEIWKPQNQETLINTGGLVTVNIRVAPPLQSGHTLSLYLDGRRVEGFAENSESYELKEVPRGVHSVSATIHDRNGTQLQETAPVAFTVRQESIANPPVGPALRPPPKPQPRRGANRLLTRQPSYAALHGAPPRIDLRTNRPVAPPAPPKGPKQGN